MLAFFHGSWGDGRISEPGIELDKLSVDNGTVLANFAYRHGAIHYDVTPYSFIIEVEKEHLGGAETVTMDLTNLGG